VLAGGLMSRSLVVAAEEVFRRLEAHAERMDDSVQTPGKPRWIAGDARERDVLANARCVRIEQFGRSRFISEWEFDRESYLLTGGFSHLDRYINSDTSFDGVLEERSCDAGWEVAAIFESMLQPNVSGTDARDFVEAGSKEDAGYFGHDWDSLSRLFPRVRIFRLSLASPWSFEQIATLLTLWESEFEATWINEDLGTELRALVSFSLDKFPYFALARASLDVDPRNGFLALYRCIEATYAFEKSLELKGALGLTTKWEKVADVLGETLSWRPREATALEIVLRHALPYDLRDVTRLIGFGNVSPKASEAAKAIYRLRNRIVHFGAARDSVGMDEYDWNGICVALTRVVCVVYEQAFPAVPTSPQQF
jgi:hypothetical protein